MPESQPWSQPTQGDHLVPALYTRKKELCSAVLYTYTSYIQSVHLHCTVCTTSWCYTVQSVCSVQLNCTVYSVQCGPFFMEFSCTYLTIKLIGDLKIVHNYRRLIQQNGVMTDQSWARVIRAWHLRQL